MTFREIRHDSGDYHREVKLRFDVLRRQLAPGAADDDYAAEAGFIHFGLFDGDEIVACCFVVPMSGDTVRLRQMAVHPDRHRLGLGRRLIREVETELARRGCHCIVLHAREGARGFYERTGYAVTSDAFTEVGIPHFRMEKPLP